VEDNLRIGATTKRPGPWDLTRVYDLFPALHARRNQPGTALSGGQQQMVAVGRALMANPDLLLCDEISLGLAPTVIKDIYRGLEAVIAQGTSVVVVEQDIAQALKVSSRFYCFQEGRVSLKGRPGEVSTEAISAAYFGV
jgi:branched-chain amino acid transport system ATP-binding protein